MVTLEFWPPLRFQPPFLDENPDLSTGYMDIAKLQLPDREYQLVTASMNIIEGLLVQHLEAPKYLSLDQKTKYVEDYLTDDAKIKINNLRLIRNSKDHELPGRYYLDDPYGFLYDATFCMTEIIKASERYSEEKRRREDEYFANYLIQSQRR